MSRRSKFLAFLLMIAFGVGVNRYIALHKTALTATATTPNHTKAAFALPGTIYLAQDGKIYSLTNGDFSVVPLPDAGAWMQPHVLPDGTLMVIARGPAYSDLYHVRGDGSVIAQLTHNHVSDKVIQENHWVFWPTTNADGGTLYASYDLPKPAYNVSYQEDLSIWAGQPASKLNAVRWSVPDPYTGGDVQPQVLADGSIVYATYAIAPSNHVVSVIAWQKTPTAKIVPLTTQDDDCNSPAVAPDGITIAMVCSADSQATTIKIAHLTAGKLDTPVTAVSACLCNSPAWAPDGSGMLYLAPGDATGKFQMWWLKGAGTATPDAPKLVSDGSVDLDALSPPTWFIAGAKAATSAPS